MSYLYTPDDPAFVEAGTGYASWAISASAITAVPSAHQEDYGWDGNDLVSNGTMNWLMKQSQSWFQSFLETGLFHSSRLSEFYGDGRDGGVSVTGSITLTRDMYYSTLAISGSGSINTAGFRIFALELDISAAQAGAIKFNGNAGSAGTGAIYLAGTAAGGAGGTSVVGSFASVSGDAGGSSPNIGPAIGPTTVQQRSVFASYIDGKRYGGDGGYFGSSVNLVHNTLPSVGTANYNAETHYAPLVDSWANAWRGKVIAGGVGGGGGGAGAGGESSGLGTGGGGGGGGASGGFVYIGAQYILASTATAAGAIQAKGGAGGAGGVGETSGNGGGGGGGGAGGSGGTVVILCDAVFDANSVDQEQTSTGFADVIDVSGGAGGDGNYGTVGGEAGAPGNGGDGGNGGIVVILQNALTEDDDRKVIWAPATALGADGQRLTSNYFDYGTVLTGGAGGVWKVAL